jgi:hypothetical protein
MLSESRTSRQTVFDEDVYPQLARLRRILLWLKISGVEDLKIDTEHFKISGLLSARPDLLPNSQ